MIKIIFRAWDIYDNSMIQTSGCSNQFVFDGDGFDRVEIPWVDGVTRTSIDSARLILMPGIEFKSRQFFVNDIISNENCSYLICFGGVDIPITKEYSQSIIGFYIKDIKTEAKYFMDMNLFNYNIIGNKFENPELIE